MDKVIVRQVLDGDLEAFRHLISKYKNRCYTLAKNILKSDLSAEDAVQDAFIKVFQHLHKFRRESAFSTWLYRIVVNESIKKLKNKPFIHNSTQVEIIDENEVSFDPEVLERLHLEEQKELINSVLNTLKTSESLLLKLFYLEELSMQEIKQITGLTINNIKVILHRARKNFAEHYKMVLTYQM